MMRRGMPLASRPPAGSAPAASLQAQHAQEFKLAPYALSAL